MSTTLASYPGPDRPARASFGLDADRVNVCAFALWVVVTFVQFRFDELLLYPLALYFAYSALRNQVEILALLRRSWILLSFPIWCLISPLWAVEPMAALKLSVYLTLTMLICFQVAISLSPRQIMHSVLLATAAITVINIFYIHGPANNPNGVFLQKNSMGKNMVVAWVVAASVALDPGTGRKLRLAAAGVAALAGYTAFISNSATAVLLVLGTGAVLVFGAAMLQGGLLRAGRLAVLCFMLGGTLGAASLVLPQTQVDPVEKVLDAFGKDRGLTGRSGLRHYAREQIKEEPLLGVGGGGFWRYQVSPLVRRIYEEYYKGPWDAFNFHNSYFEIAVHQGLIGLGLAIVSSIWAVVWIFRGALILATMPQIYFLAQSLAVLARTPTEADFLRPFTIFHMLFWIGALSALKLFMDKNRTSPPR